MGEDVLLSAAMLVSASSLAAAAVAWVFVGSARPETERVDGEG